MKCKRGTVLVWFAVAALAAAVAGCGDDDGGDNNNLADAGPDAEIPDGQIPDGRVPDGEVPDAGPTQGCTGESPADPAPMGACCNVDDDCVDGFCVGGWCSTRQCETDNDCQPAAPGPFPTGTPMRCNVSGLDILVSPCAPGSLQDCGGSSDAPCPTGEVCVLGLNDDAVVPTENGLRSVCVTALEGGIATGQTCDENADPFDYQCEAPGYIFSSCMNRRCTMGCDPANPTDPCPAGMQCAGPLAFDVNGPLVGGGMCMGQICGSLKFSGDPENDVRIPGLDSACPSGEVCTTGFVTGVDADTLEMNCIPNNNNLLSPGAACEHAEKYDLFCNHLGLCLQASAEWDPNGAWCQDHEDCDQNEVCAEHSSPYVPSHCSAKPDPGFCTMMCRTDADCSTYPNDTAYCVELDGGLMPNGESSYITVCYPETELFDHTPTGCATEMDCDAGTGEGCLNVSFHSTATVCATTVEQDPNGTVCSSVSQCNAGEACIAGDTESRCTAVKTVGDTCDATDEDCLSGWCVDFEFETDDNGSPTNTFCVGTCVTTTDCATNMVCENVMLAENDPATEADDVVAGLCRPMTIRNEAQRCTASSDCTNAGRGDTCHVPTGRCYTNGTAWGAACTAHHECHLNGICDTDAPGGMCYLPGCDPANGNADCGGGDTVCSTNSVVGVCVEACTSNTECTRNGAGYVCNNGACEAP